MKPYKVLVVDDSAFMRKIISDLIENDPDFRVTATAATGREAIEKVSELQPDLVTMDVEMPEMNGLEALKVIMAKHPLPVIMLSGINEEGMRETIMALESGAFDFIRKPSITNSQDIMTVGLSLIEQMKGAMLAREQREARISSLKVAEITLPEPARPVNTGRTAVPELSVRKPELSRKSAEAPAKQGVDKLRPPALEPGAKLTNSGKSGMDTMRNVPKTPVSPLKPAAERLKNRKQPDAAPSLPEIKAVPEVSSVSRPELPPASAGARKPGTRSLHKLVAVGCSTGGPRALKHFLRTFPQISRHR